MCTFEHLTTQGRTALSDHDPQTASDHLTKALNLWRGRALVGVTTGEILSAHVTRLEEDRLRALEMRIEADMHLGRYQELISELKVLVYTYPLHERFHGDLMTALNRSGRRYEALEVYRRLREVLIDELGLEPSAPMQRLHEALLTADTTEPADHLLAHHLPFQQTPARNRRRTRRTATR
ncbi:AfsR/SARP family transcriptional regulator [Actinoallomurus liliacearum]|uniref:AfsR/SARP family transcriptional regulator n=1 Tax=Actinoallomurus liliacearum TaxID=1080073 RepID=UPI003CD06230